MFSFHQFVLIFDWFQAEAEKEEAAKRLKADVKYIINAAFVILALVSIIVVVCLLFLLFFCFYYFIYVYLNLSGIYFHCMFATGRGACPSRAAVSLNTNV